MSEIVADDQTIFESEMADQAVSDDDSQSLDVLLAQLQQAPLAGNLAETLDESELARIGQTVVEEFEIDLASRADWEKAARQNMKLAMQVREAKNSPWPNASNVKFPLITVAALQFNARAYPAIINDGNVVKGRVVGYDEGVPAVDPQTGQPVIDPQTGQPAFQVPPGFKREKANRVASHMSWQISEQMDNWEEETDVILMQTPIIGCAFRKVFHDPKSNRRRSEMVSALDFVVNSDTKSLSTTPRATQIVQVYPRDAEEKFRSGEWRRIDIETANADNDKDSPHEFLEQHRYLDLDGDDYAEPYIVTVHRETGQVVAIAANWKPDIAESVVTNVQTQEIIRIEKREHFVKYPFLPDPEGGFYDIGFGRLLESLSAAIDTSINQMLDAGTLQNAGGGFIGSGVRLKKDRVSVQPGRYQTVNVTGATLRDAIYNHNHPGPSAVLFQLLGLLIEAAKDVTAVQDIMTGDTGNRQQTATTTLALIEQGMKVFTAIYKRIYRALRKEFKLLFELNAEHLNQAEYFEWADTQAAVSGRDYDTQTLDIAPAADPRVTTDMQKLARGQILLQFANDPFIDPVEVRTRYLEAAGIEGARDLVTPQQPNPLAIAEAEAKVRKILSEAMRNETSAKKDEAEIMEKGERMELDVDKAMFEIMQALQQMQAPQVESA